MYVHVSGLFINYFMFFSANTLLIWYSYSYICSYVATCIVINSSLAYICLYYNIRNISYLCMLNTKYLFLNLGNGPSVLIPCVKIVIFELFLLWTMT